MTPEDEKEIELLKIQREIWAKAVDTQMHFNEMSVKSRQLGLSFVVGALALAAILLGRQEPFLIPIPLVESLFGVAIQIHVAGVVVVVAAAGLWAVRRLDLLVYHQMLRGAVTFGEAFEEKVLRTKLMNTQKGMTEFISMFSRYRVVDKREEKGEVIYVPRENTRETAEEKLEKFYSISLRAIIGIGIVLILFSGSIKKISQQNAPSARSVEKTQKLDKPAPPTLPRSSGTTEKK